MVKYTNEERLQIIKIYYLNFGSVTATFRALTPIFGRRSRPSRQAIHSLVKKFHSTFSLLDIPVPVRKRSGRSNESIAAVKASLQKDPNQSIQRRSQELGISQSTLWRILREDLSLQPFKIKLPQNSKSEQILSTAAEIEQESDEGVEMESSEQVEEEEAEKTSESSSKSKRVLKQALESRAKKHKSG